MNLKEKKFTPMQLFEICIAFKKRENLEYLLNEKAFLSYSPYKPIPFLNLFKIKTEVLNL